MYHISNDIRAQNSAQRICDALMECSKYKIFSEITVTDLYKKYHISRTTFYRHFDNTVDVLEYSCEQMGQSILLNVRGNTPREFTINAITALKEQRELIALLSKSGHLDIFQKIQEKYLPLSKLAIGMDLDSCYHYFHRLLAQLIPTAIDIWVKEGQEDTSEEIYENMHQSIKLLESWFSK